MDGKTISFCRHPTVPGLYYWPDVISEEHSGKLLEFIRSDKVSWKAVGSSTTSRIASHSGYDYDYTSKRVTASEPIPKPFQKLAKLADACCEALLLNTEEFNQCLVNEYLGEHSHGIGWHVDVAAFGPVIACYTLCSGAEMHFRDHQSGTPVKIRVEPRSLYIMSGESRSSWQHSMPCRKSDPNPNGGARIKRGTRYSVTFRSVPSLSRKG